MADKFRVTVKEKILIHLLSYTKYAGEVEAPVEVSQEGMAKSVGVRRSHIASALKDLKAQDFIEEKKIRIKGHERRKNAYFLSHEGQTEALRLKESFYEKKITLVLEDEEKVVELSEIARYIPERLSFLEIINRISDEGTFDTLKPEKSPERTVICPFCGGTNKDFELKAVQLQSGVEANALTCVHCNGEFLAAKTQSSETEDTIRYTASFIPPDGTGEVYKPTRMGNSFLVSLGFIFMLASFALVILLGLDYINRDFNVLIIVGFAISLSLLFLAFYDVKHLETMARRILILAGTLFLCFMAVFLGVLTDATYDSQQTLIMASVLLPAFGVFIFATPLSSELRSELSLSLGVFLVLFGIFLMIFTDLFSWSFSYSPFWVIAGAAMIMMSNEIAKLGKFYLLRALCMGTGSFMVAFCLIVIADYQTLGMLKTASVVLWIIIGAFLIIMRFQSEESGEKVLLALKGSLLMGLGILFVLVGVLLALNDRMMESVVEMFIGVPIAGLGAAEAQKFTRPQIAVVALIIVTEVLTVFSFAFT
jgi:hypothetical protein